LAVDRSAQLIQDSKTFRGWLIGALAGMVLPSSHAIADRGVSPEKIADPLTLYGNEIHFDVYREGDKVGFHSVGFETDGRNLFVRSSFRVEIDVLFFTAYRYLYQSEAKWVEGKLETLKASVDDDGSAFSLSAVRQGKRMNITSTDGGFSADAPLIPTNHWNRARERVATERGHVTATHYAYTGDLNTEVWYDDLGRWVKMRFLGPDGSAIEYVCRRCQGSDLKKAQQ
jgi:hypothetical protein